MNAILTSLKDIPGVIGSFVLTPQGALVAKEMPAVYPEAIFPDLGRRLVSVGEVLDGQTAPFQELLLKFEGSWLFIRRTTQCLLSVLVAENVNYPALRMATNVAFRQVAERMVAMPVLAAPAAESAPGEAESAPKPAVTKSRRIWRGQVID